jgi:rhamnose utilization protein RhaD (predicted bifunctional aldolase and dehydrogenase)
VLHVHSVNTIAWAVRRDARVQLEHQLDGLRWRWIPYIRSGLPLAREIEKALAASANTEVLVLGNHGLVVAGDDCGAVENLLSEVERRLSIRPRQAPPADYAALVEIADGSAWEVPEDNAVHALARTRFLRRSFREVSSIRARRSCRTRTLPRCSGRLPASIPQTNGRVDSALASS